MKPGDRVSLIGENETATVVTVQSEIRTTFVCLDSCLKIVCRRFDQLELIPDPRDARIELLETACQTAAEILGRQTRFWKDAIIARAVLVLEGAIERKGEI